MTRRFHRERLCIEILTPAPGTPARHLYFLADALERIAEALWSAYDEALADDRAAPFAGTQLPLPLPERPTAAPAPKS